MNIKKNVLALIFSTFVISEVYEGYTLYTPTEGLIFNANTVTD